MRYLGIDFGAKNVGIAVSNEERSMSFPFVVLDNTENLIDEISKICTEKEVGLLVIGESKNYSGEENEIMKKITPFAKELEVETGIKVAMHPEFMTSLEAQHLQGHNDMHDASAAAIILNSYIESNK